jgi:hypothetical protein
LRKKLDVIWMPSHQANGALGLFGILVVGCGRVDSFSSPRQESFMSEQQQAETEMESRIVTSHFHVLGEGERIGFAAVEYRGATFFLNAKQYDTEDLEDENAPNGTVKDVPVFELHVLNPDTDEVMQLAPCYSNETDIAWLVFQAEDAGLFRDLLWARNGTDEPIAREVAGHA